MQALLNAIAQMDLPTDATRVFHGRGGLYPGSGGGDRREPDGGQPVAEESGGDGERDSLMRGRRRITALCAHHRERLSAAALCSDLREEGVSKALQIIHKELDVTMAFCGHTNIQNVNTNILLPGTFPTA